jgi:hypothetical protein
MTLATTYFSVANANTEGRKAIEVDDVLWHVGEPTMTPLLTLVGGKLYKKGDDTPEEVAGKISKKMTTQVDFKVIEKESLTRTVQAAAAVADITTTTVVLDSNAACTVGDILTNKMSGERLFVVAVDSGGANLTVKRNLGATAFQIADDDVFFISGHASKQGGSKRTMKSILAAPRTRYCQIFKRTFGITRTLAASQLETKINALDEEQQQALVEHKKDIEFAFWANAAADSTLDAAGSTVYLTRGIESELAGDTYTTDCGGSMDEDYFFSTVMEDVFRYGPNTKVLFADAKMISRISGFQRVKLQAKVGENRYGQKVTEVFSNHGTLQVVPCGVYGQYKDQSQEGFGTVLDLDRVEMRFMENRDTKMEMDIQTPGDDVIEGQYYSEVGISLKSLLHHRIIKNIG